MEPWLNEDGSTNVDGFLAAYAADDNTFWRVDIGHIMNVLDELIDRAQPYVTKTGKVLTDADIQALADEAEQGYNVEDLTPHWKYGDEPDPWSGG